MRYLIDGYNLLHRLEVRLKRPGAPPLEAARRRLLDRLSRGHAHDDAEVTVVFDAAGAPPGAPAADSYRGLRVLFSRGQSADDLIEDLLRREPAPPRLTVVSDDARLLEAARRRGCPVLRCLDYLDGLGARPPAAAPAPEPPCKPDAATDEDRRLAEEFETLFSREPGLSDWLDPPPPEEDGLT